MKQQQSILEEIKELDIPVFLKKKIYDFLSPFIEQGLEIDCFPGLYGEIIATAYDEPYYFEYIVEPDGMEILAIERGAELIFYSEHYPVMTTDKNDAIF